MSLTKKILKETKDFGKHLMIRAGETFVIPTALQVSEEKSLKQKEEGVEKQKPGIGEKLGKIIGSTTPLTLPMAASYFGMPTISGDSYSPGLDAFSLMMISNSLSLGYELIKTGVKKIKDHNRQKKLIKNSQLYSSAIQEVLCKDKELTDLSKTELGNLFKKEIYSNQSLEKFIEKISQVSEDYSISEGTQARLKEKVSSTYNTLTELRDYNVMKKGALTTAIISYGLGFAAGVMLDDSKDLENIYNLGNMLISTATTISSQYSYSGNILTAEKESTFGKAKNFLFEYLANCGVSRASLAIGGLTGQAIKKLVK